MERVRTALTIAGSDSGGGAGIQADLKTFSALGVFGMSALTAITAQNTAGVTAVFELPPDLVAAQIDAVVTDIGVDAVKTGMIANSEIIRVVAAKVREHGISTLVVDPVMVATSGDRLLREDAVEALRAELLPLATVVTPNLPEAEVLVGREVSTLADMRDAARAIVGLGARSAVVKGGHLDGDAIDVFFDGEQFRGATSPADRDDEHPRDRLHARLGDRGAAGARAVARGGDQRRQGVRDGGDRASVPARARARAGPPLPPVVVTRIRVDGSATIDGP